eukprot:scaffold33993_cov66-Attheya_sp.AAC.2
MTCGTICMYITSQYADLRCHITKFGEHITYPVDDNQSIHEYLDTVNLDKVTLFPDSTPGSGNTVYNPSPSPQPHIARVNGNQDIPSCECCLRRGHLADTCFARGIQFLPPDVQHHIAQYNAMHGDRPKVPPKASTHPPLVKYPPRLPHQSAVPKANIKVLIGDLTDNDQLITDPDPEIFDFIDHEEAFVDDIDTSAARVPLSKRCQPITTSCPSFQTIMDSLIQLNFDCCREARCPSIPLSLPNDVFSYKVIKTHFDGGANVFALLTNKSLFYIFKEKNMPYPQASGGTDTADGLGMALFQFPGGTKIYPCPAYYVPDNSSSTFSPGALKYFIGFKVAQCNALSHCNFSDPQGHNTVIRTKVDNLLDYFPLEFLIPSDPKFKQSLTAIFCITGD